MQQNPAEALLEIQRLQRHTNSILRHISFPCMLFGALMVLGTGIGMAFGGAANGMYWLLAGPTGAVFTGLYYHRRETKLGVTVNPVPWIGTSVALMAGCIATGFGGATLDVPVLSSLGPLLCISAGYLVFGRLAGSRLLQVSAAVLSMAVLAMWVMGATEQIWFAASGLYGAVTFIIGLLHRGQEVQVP